MPSSGGASHRRYESKYKGMVNREGDGPTDLPESEPEAKEDEDEDD